ncbi:LuxR C-terminal-related transcriptional regulator [Kalamiella sp. sgz302252]|uniref:helix-turn-helix transcriptional regulator n=1 Tax=Pantoea sp. sgz302252 TaxID=3341827 RepID=UPI0036D43456
MKVLIVDPLSFFVQGMISGLKEIMPDMDVKGISCREDILSELAAHPVSIIIMDGGTGSSEQFALLDDIVRNYPDMRIIVTLLKVGKDALRRFLEHHAVAVISKASSLEIFSQVIRTACCGMVCIPDGEHVWEINSEQELIMKLSERQREVLKLIAAGESNKQISRHLNISAGTVKSHLESIYRRLNVKNRTQAAMMMSLED